MKTETLQVELAERSYPIFFQEATQRLAATIGELRVAGRALRCISDRSVLDAHPELAAECGLREDEILALPPGEVTKSIQSLDQALRFLASGACNRDCAVFALGGGVIGDLAGYTAASYLRGVDFYQIPTTLLAMVDSAVGGKTGINLPEGKNLVGAFWQPKAVFIDTALLATLPQREFAAGMAEVIKYGLLADAALLTELESIKPLQPHSAELPGIVRWCCEIKARIVAGDEKETAGSGGRALLNLGHTFAHAIENVAGYGAYLHGEAVAIGLVLAARLSEQLGQVGPEVVARTEAVLQRHGLPTQLEQGFDVEALMAAMQRDKKNRGGQLRFVTLEAPGRVVTSEGVDPALVRRLWATA